MSKIIKRFSSDNGKVYNVTDEMVENRKTFVQYCLDRNTTVTEAVARICWAQGREFMDNLENVVSLFIDMGLKEVKNEIQIAKEKLNEAGFKQEPAYWVLHDIDSGKIVRMATVNSEKFACVVWFTNYAEHDEDGNPVTDIDTFDNVDSAIKAAKDFMEAQ